MARYNPFVKTFVTPFAALVLALIGSSCTRPAPSSALIPASSTMVTAWQIPQDPTKDTTLTDPKLAEPIKWGYRIFMDTPHEAPRLTGGKVACVNCHQIGRAHV